MRSSRKQLKDCCIAPYFINGSVLGGGAGGCAKCKDGQLSAAHHGMVDYPFRTGGASDSKYRAPSVPSYRNALTICISPEEHKATHSRFENYLSNARSQSTTPGVVTFNDVKSAAEKSIYTIPANELSTDCKYLYEVLLEQQYRPGGDTLMRGTPNAPTPGSDPDTTRLDALKKSWGLK